jgi:hypothetical protein
MDVIEADIQLNSFFKCVGLTGKIWILRNI